MSGIGGSGQLYQVKGVRTSPSYLSGTGRGWSTIAGTGGGGQL